MNDNPYHPTSALGTNPQRKSRVGIIPATVVAFAALLVLAMTVIQFHDAMLGEISRSFANGYVVHAIACIVASLVLLTCAVTLGAASREWLSHRVRNALFLTFFAPPALILLAAFLMYGVG